VALICEKKVSNEQVLQCDKCKKTRAMDLTTVLNSSFYSIKFWSFLGDDKWLCPDCVKAILDAWYNQQDVGNFHLTSSSEEIQKRRKKKKVVA